MSVSSASIDERLEALFRGDPAVLGDPHPLYHELRETLPVHAYRDTVVVSRYEDVKLVMRDAARFSSKKGADSNAGRAFRKSVAPKVREAYDYNASIEQRWLTRIDGSEHARMRAVAHRAFTPKEIAKLAEAAQTYVDGILDEFARSGDVVDLKQLAYRVPLMIVGDLLGAQKDELELIHDWSSRILTGLNPEAVIEANIAYRAFADYVAAVIERQRVDGATSALGAALIEAERDGTMDKDDLTAMFIVLLFAGHETTTSLISIGALELLRRPDQWQLFCDTPDLTSNAVEELLRFVSPIGWNNRQAAAEVELRGMTIEPGQDIHVNIAGANRDPQVFEDPDMLDIARPSAGQHVALGFGSHFCLGGALARLEGRIALATLARRFPQLELATNQIVWSGSPNIRRITALPVRLGAEQN